MNYLIYKITNLINNKIYIGCHITKNIDDSYFGSGSVLNKAIKKYKKENFKKEIIYFCVSKEEMFNIEKQIVNEEFIKSNNNYNIKLGGLGGFDYINKNNLNDPYINFENSKELNKKAIKKFKILYKEDEEFKNKMLLKSKKGIKRILELYPKGTFFGKKHKESSKIKIGLYNSIRQKGSGNSNFGNVWIYSKKEKISKSIPKTDLKDWILKGWVKGRKMSFV